MITWLLKASRFFVYQFASWAFKSSIDFNIKGGGLSAIGLYTVENHYECMICVVLCTFCFDISVVGVSDFCFGCRDTSDAEGKDDCQKQTEGMDSLHYTYKTQYGNNSKAFLAKYGKDPLVHDCRPYHKYNMTHCCIEELERLGKSCE